MTKDIAALNYFVIDDDATTHYIKQTLHDIGANTIHCVDNIKTAIKCIKQTKKQPDIIICALTVTEKDGVDGVQFLRRLAEKQFAGGLILIGSEERRFLRISVRLAEAHRLNALGFLHKPFSAAALLAIISSFKGLKETPSPLPILPITAKALRTAIEQDQIIPFFQAKVAIKTGKLIGVETLARWQHPKFGVLLPDLFIPAAEEYGLIGMLTQAITSKAFRQVVTWHKAGLTLPVAINISGPSLSNINLADTIACELDKNGITHSELIIEITESGLCADTTVCMETLLRLRLKDIRLSIDDFGTGHSTQEQLHKMPFSELKIDRMFVTGAAHDNEALLFFQSAVALAKKLNLTTVAEGVETQEDWDVCAKLGCDMAQGFLIGHPVPGEAFLNASTLLSFQRDDKDRVKKKIRLKNITLAAIDHKNAVL